MTSSTFTLNMLHKIVKKFALRMTVSLTLALITTVALFNLAESIPSTFCITRICTGSSGFSGCQLTGILEVRSRYSGRMNLMEDGRTCSRDGVFCVDVVGGTGDFFITYANKSHYVHHSARQWVTGTWCTLYYNGAEFWLEL